MLRSTPRLRRGALLIRGPCAPRWVPALRRTARALRRVRDTSQIGSETVDSVFDEPSRHTSTLSRHTAPEFCKFIDPQERAQAIPKGTQGRPGARCTRGLACKKRKEHAHEHTGSAEAVRPSLRNGFTAYFVLSLATGFLSPSFPRSLLLRNLTPASGRQNHTTSPSASRAVRQKRIGVHRISPRRS
jgi:hypothetical protein